MKNNIFKYLTLLFAFVIISCDDYEVGGTATKEFSGDWWVTYYYENNGTWEKMHGPVFFTTYNTAANLPTEMFVDDHKTFWEYKAKIKVDVNTHTFGSDQECDNLYYDSKIKVYDGKIYEGLGLSKTGVVTDSISFYIWFNDAGNDPATYRVEGHRRTGFHEDEF